MTETPRNNLGISLDGIDLQAFEVRLQVPTKVRAHDFLNSLQFLTIGDNLGPAVVEKSSVARVVKMQVGKNE